MMADLDTDRYGFCGQPLMENEAIYNESAIPNVSRCFQHSLLVAVPCFFFWILFPAFMLQTYRLRQSKRFLPLPFHPLLLLKLALGVLAFADSIFIFSRYFVDKNAGAPTPTVLWIYPVLLMLTSGGLVFCHFIATRVGNVSSGIIFNSWFVLTVAGVPELYYWSKVSSDGDWRGRDVGFFIWWSACLLQTFLFTFADKRSAKERRNTELDSSFLNRVTLWWFTRVPLTGAKKDLEEVDLFELNEGNTAAYLEPIWDEHWQPTIEKYYEKKRQALAEQASDKLMNGSSDTARTDGSPVSDKEKKVKPLIPPPSIIHNLFKMFKFEFFAAMFIKATADVLQFANPFLLNMLLNYISDSNGHLWQGIAYGLLMFGASELRSFMVNYYFFIMFRMGIKIQTTLVSAVYRKTLRLSNIARRDKTVGEIVNLMAIDVERFQLITSQIQQYWSSPFQIILCLIFLFKTLGISALPGVFITAAFIPFNVVTSIAMRRWMRTQMKLKDERTKMISEVLNGIKVVKLYAWELPMMKLVELIRSKELDCIFKASLIRLSVDVFNWSTPFMVALFSFMTFTLTSSEHKLTPQIAFVSLTLFNQLRSPMTMIGLLINMTVEAIVSNKRLKEFFIADELDEHAIDRSLQTGGNYELIEAKSAEFSWDVAHDSAASARATPSLQSVTLSISRGSLVAVVGRVGAGKSSLLSALLGEMEKLRGLVAVRGQIAYVPQQAWIQNMSLRENIMFGRPYDKRFYQKVIDACALGPDLAILPHGDKTEIGEKGINLSGGQKARISLARAVYQNSDVYFLDDPLSAVDSHVGRHIFNKVIGPKGLLRNKTRILVTHGITFLPRMDQVLVVDDGRIVEQGLYSDLVSNEGRLNELVSAAKEEKEEESPSDSVTPSDSPSPSLKKKPIDDADETDGYDEPERISMIDDGDIDLPEATLERQTSTVSALAREGMKHRSSAKTSTLSMTSPVTPSDKSTSKLITKETVETGRVKAGVYVEYVRAAGYVFTVFYCGFYVVYQGVAMGRNFWLSKWADDNDPKNAGKPHMDSNQRLGIYAGMGVTETIAMALGLLGLVFGGIRASKNLHEPVFKNILRSPMSFFDTTPVGRILNRLAKDVDVVDMRLPMNFRYFANCLTQVFFTLLIIIITTPIFMAVVVPLGAIYLISLRYYVPTSRQLRRLESNHRSPIYSHFSETVQGSAVIRAFDRTEDFCATSSLLVDRFCHVKYMNLIANRWLAVRLEFIGNMIVFFATLFAVLSTHWGWISSPGLVGLSVSYALNITEVLNFAVRQIGELETNIVSVERLKEYTETVTEAPWEISDKKPPSGWPSRGQIEFRGYSTRYRPGLDLVVKDINAFVRPGEKIGIVGRTGAGKSSLTLALFRMIEAAEGRISIDGIPICDIGLHDLRSNITIIPQDPVLFSGSLRFNLDPFDRYSDDQVWNALELAHLKEFVAGLAHGLSHVITEGGDNISVGQRQLVCLARALLRRSKVLVLDEATAAVDLYTDALIQDTIRTEFRDSTIFTIAHRLNTILDYDRVMVLDKGEIKELDSPAKLLADKDSMFAAMVLDAKNTTSQEEEEKRQ